MMGDLTNKLSNSTCTKFLTLGLASLDLLWICFGFALGCGLPRIRYLLDKFSVSGPLRSLSLTKFYEEELFSHS